MIIAFNDNDSNTQKKNFPNNDNNNNRVSQFELFSGFFRIYSSNIVV